jgi:hypothetical protein
MEQDGESKSRDSFITTEGDCDTMKTVILITVIESSAVMLAILYFYYRRRQSGKRTLVFVAGRGNEK